MGFDNIGSLIKKLSDIKDIPGYVVGKVLGIDETGKPAWVNATSIELNYPEVATYADLPVAIAGAIYIVNTTTGIYGFRKLAGFYQTDGTTWTYLGAGDWVDIGSNQTIGGVKTFTQSPVMPDGTVSASKAQVDAVNVLARAIVLDKDLTAPPVSPIFGDTYLINIGAIGSWAGQDGKITYYDGLTWVFIDVPNGYHVYVTDESKFYIKGV